MWMKTRRYPLWRWLEKSIEKQKMKIIFQPGMEKVFKKAGLTVWHEQKVVFQFKKVVSKSQSEIKKVTVFSARNQKSVAESKPAFSGRAGYW